MNQKRKSIGIRIPNNKIALALLEDLGEPLMSTSLILSGSEVTESDPIDIREKLEHQVDVIIDGGVLGNTPTTVVNFEKDIIEIMREGSGDISPFVN